MKLEEGDVVLCIVDRIVGTTVFVKIEDDGEGSIITSEIAPGRIRNLRDYVFPKKKIVCKILRIGQQGNIELTLRRVIAKERKEVMELYRQEKSAVSILKSVLGEKVEEIIEKIKKISETGISEFLQEVKEDSRKLEEFIGKENSEKILKILRLEKKKKASVKKEILLRTIKPDGLCRIKSILCSFKNPEITITYISAGKYSIKSDSTDLKKADNNLKEIIEEIEKRAKNLGVEFSVKASRGK